MAPQDVDPQALIDAAQKYLSAYGGAFNAVYNLPHELDRNSGCAGDDSSGRRWSQGYDPAATKAVAAGVDVVRGFGKLHDLLACTGVNYANAEAAAKRPPGASLPAPQQVEAGGATAPASFKGAFGGDVPPPSGWDMLTSWLQGHLWPNGNPEKLRGLGAAWFAAGKSLREAGERVGPAWETLEDMSAPSLDQAMEQMDLVASTAEDVAQQFDTLGGACRYWADTIEEAHTQLISLVAIAVLAIIALGAVGGLIGTLAEPGGGTALGAGVGGGAGAALTISRILTILIGLDTTALALAAAAGTVVAVVAAADTAINNLQPLLQADASTLGNGGGGIGRPKDWRYSPAPSGHEAPGFPGFSSKGVPRKTRMPGGGERKRWKDKDGNILEWDYQHGAYEKYDKSGRNHLGEYDTSGKQTKPADPTRKVEK